MYQAYQIYYLYRKYWVSQIYQLYQIHLTYHRWKTEIYHDDDQSCAPIEDVVVSTGKRAWTLSLIVKQLFIFIIITIIMIVIIIIIVYNKPVRPDKAALVRFSKLQTSPLAQCTSPVLAQHNRCRLGKEWPRCTGLISTSSLFSPIKTAYFAAIPWAGWTISNRTLANYKCADIRGHTLLWVYRQLIAMPYIALARQAWIYRDISVTIDRPRS